MAEFSSCYFCGAALDAPLDEYPVVPAELHPSPEQQGTVVLCPTCREKLGAIVGEVVAAVETESSFEGPRTTDATLEAAAEGATESTDTGSATTYDAPEGDDETALDEVTEAEATTEPSDAADEDESPDAPEEKPPERRTTAAGETDAEPSPIFDDDSSDESDESDPYGPVFGDDETAPEIDEGPGDGSDEEPEPSPDEGEPSATTADHATGASGPMPDARTYNRVVRLLQNREFPVEREEIEAVATNAYELSAAEFDAVIRVAVDRGVLEAEDGLLKLPGGN
jgi:hypothetical protein